MQIKAFLLNKSLTFNTTWGLFCPEEIDAGTKLLLKAISGDEKVLEVLGGNGAQDGSEKADGQGSSSGSQAGGGG